MGRDTASAVAGRPFGGARRWSTPAVGILLLVASLLAVSTTFAARNEAAIQLENRTGLAVLVRLVGPTAAVVAVPQGEQRTVAVAPGSYQILVRYGAEPTQFTYGRAESVAVPASGGSPITVTLRPPGSGGRGEAPAAPPTQTMTTPPQPPAAVAPPSPQPPAAVAPPPPQPPTAVQPRRTEPPRAAGGGFVLSGNIVNIASASRYLDARAYLQLVPLPADRRLVYTSDDEGRVTYLSELARAEIAPDGHFRLMVAPLPPGDYVIVAQALKSYGPDEGPIPALADTYTRATQVITVPAERTAPLVQHLGALYIPTPVQGR
jgi:hypothetical protein